jgi:hypothetical protein
MLTQATPLKDIGRSIRLSCGFYVANIRYDLSTGCAVGVATWVPRSVPLPGVRARAMRSSQLALDSWQTTLEGNRVGQKKKQQQQLMHCAVHTKEGTRQQEEQEKRQQLALGGGIYLNTKAASPGMHSEEIPKRDQPFHPVHEKSHGVENSFRITCDPRSDRTARISYDQHDQDDTYFL